MRISCFFLGILAIAVTVMGFSHDRSVSLIYRQRRNFFDRISKKLFSVPGGWDNIPIDKVLKTSDVKKAIKPEDETTDYPFSEKRSDLLASEIQKNPKINEHDEMKGDIIFPIEENSSFMPKSTQSVNPKNVILLFINESGQDQLALWANLRNSNQFPIHGYLHSCRHEGNLFRIPLGEYFPSNENDQAECEKSLRSSIDSLLSWAHRARKMATGVVEDSIAPIPLAAGYESSIFNQNSESADEKKMQSFRPQSHDDWHLIDLDKDNLSSNPSTVSAAPKKEGEGMWDLMDTFSKMRLALFRNWLKEFRKNAADFDQFSPLKPIPIELSLVDLMGDTVKKLKSLSDEKGFVMIAVAPANKMSSAIEILDKEITATDTLLVVTGACAPERKFVPFFVRGPGANYFYDAKTLWDLPLVVKKALSGCQGIWCKVGALNPVWDADNDFHKRFAERFIRNTKENSTATGNITEEVKKENSTITGNITEEVKALNETEVKIVNKTEDHSMHHQKSTDNSVQNSTKKPEVKSSESSSTKLSQESTDNKNETSTQKAITENQAIVNQTSEAENTMEIVEVDQRMLVTAGASSFSMKTTSAIIGIMTSFATTSFLNF